MNTKSLAFLSLLASIATVPAWALTTTWENLKSPLTEDTTVSACGSISVDTTIDLAGHKLYLEGLTGLSGSGSFTDSTTDKTNPGELHLILTGDITASTVGLTGNMRLVKSGTKTLEMANKTTSYTGGNIISNGTLKIGTTTQTLANFKPLGAAGGYIDVFPTGTLSLNGKYNFADIYAINLYGGTLYNDAARDDTSKLFNPIMTVYADSEYHLGNSKAYTLGGTINLRGNQLKVNLDDGTASRIFPTSVQNGTIRYEGSGTFNLKKTFDMRTVNFDEAGSKLDLGGFTLSISNYVSNLSQTRTSTTGEIDVYGSLIPNTDYFFPPTMQNGSTIDLSTKEGAWAAGGTTFADGAAINLEVGTRTLTDGEMLVTWSGTEYNGRTFNLTVNGVISADFELQAQGGGLAIMSKGAKIPTAIWSGTKGPDALDPENWTWKNKLPGDTSVLPNGTHVVEIAWNQLPNLNWPETNALGYASLAFTGEKPQETVALTGNRDWRGLGGMDVPYAIDLAGKTLAMTFKDGTSAAECEVTSLVEGGVLIAKVADDKTFDNTLVTLSGNLTLVKDGEGTFVATKCPQEYAGVTIVSNGVLKCANNANLNATEGKSPFGSQLTVNVTPDGILDPAGSYYWGNHTINLQGGMISNTVARHGMSSDGYNAANRGLLFNPTINLSAPSVFAVHGAYNYQGVLNCNGHELEIWVKSSSSLRWCPTASANAILRVTGSGAFYTLKNFAVNVKTLSLTMDDKAFFHMGGSLSISNYTAKSTVNLFDYEDKASPTMKVYGIFTPVSAYFVGCTMQNNSVIDLSGKEEAWLTTGFTKGKGTVDFADGASVTIDTGDRELRNGEQIVSWTTAPANVETLKFLFKSSTTAANMKLLVLEDGIYAVRKGLVFIVQ